MKPHKPSSRRKWIIATAIVLLAGGLIYSGMGKTKKTQYEWVLAKRGDLRQEVSVTGRVKAAESADLAFEVGGRVDSIEVKVGDSVQAGQTLIRLNSDDLKAQLRQAQAGVQSASAQLSQFQAALESQQSRLAEYRAGTRPEELQVAQTAVYNAEEQWKDASLNLQTVKSKAEADMQNVYSSAASALLKAVTTGKSALMTLTDVQYAHFNNYDQDSVTMANAKAEAVEVLLGGRDAGRWIVASLATLTGGAYADALAAQADPGQENIDRALMSVLDGLRKTKAALEAVPLTSVVTATERESLDLEKANVGNEIITVSGKQQSIDVQKAMNQNSITSAQSQENAAKNALATARDQLALKQAGYTPEQIRGQEALVRQAQANISSQKAMVAQAAASAQAIQARLDKTVLKAPLSGTVTKQETKVGEIVSPNVIVISLISELNYQIESDVAEVDIAKIKEGNISNVTLDAYGSSEEFEAMVVKIDPAETIVEGVPTYKVTLEFAEQDPRIKSGMTANLDILTDERKDVVVIPQRAVLANDGSRSVRILVSEPSPKDKSETVEVMKEVAVKTGIRGVDGNVEIIEGVKEGDKVVTSVKTQ